MHAHSIWFSRGPDHERSQPLGRPLGHRPLWRCGRRGVVAGEVTTCELNSELCLTAFCLAVALPEPANS